MQNQGFHGTSYFALSKDFQMSSIASSADMQLGNLGVFLVIFVAVGWRGPDALLILLFAFPNEVDNFAHA